jgi:hypothetical protein
MAEKSKTILFEGFMLVFGTAILILGLLIFFESGVFLNASLALLKVPQRNPAALDNVILFGKVHTYSVVLIVIGILLTMYGVLKATLREISK